MHAIIYTPGHQGRNQALSSVFVCSFNTFCFHSFVRSVFVRSFVRLLVPRAAQAAMPGPPMADMCCPGCHARMPLERVSLYAHCTSFSSCAQALLALTGSEYWFDEAVTFLNKLSRNATKHALQTVNFT
jgi:hypothetical protein